MPQIVLKERTAHLASYTFLQEMLISIKHVTFTALSTTKNIFFTEHLSLATSCEYCKVFKNNFFIQHLPEAATRGVL